MKRLRLTKYISLAIATCITIGAILSQWLISPVIPTPVVSGAAIFEQVWQTVSDRFYDPNFNGVDWKAMRSKYAPQVTNVKSRQEFVAVINLMLSELKTSHTRFYMQDEPGYYQLLGIFTPRDPDLLAELKNQFPQGKIEYTDIGVFTRNINGKTFISSVLDGSPAAEAGLMFGDQILSVDNRPFQPVLSFIGKAGTKVTLNIQPTPNSQQNIAVTPKIMDATTMFLDAQIASTQIIEREGKKIGYVHIWSYAGDQYQKQLEEDLLYGRLKNTDGFILDLRDGWGGAPLTALNIYTGANLSITNIPRDRNRYRFNSQWKKPVVMLVNEGSRSAKEILAWGFKQYKIGPVVGTKTAGAVVAGSPVLMQDGSLLYVAGADVYVNGDQRLEGKGVTPDIVVTRSLEYSQGADPQKEKAIEVVLSAINNTNSM
jgi:carboxyl-terminal processing protease